MYYLRLYSGQIGGFFLVAAIVSIIFLTVNLDNKNKRHAIAFAVCSFVAFVSACVFGFWNNTLNETYNTIFSQSTKVLSIANLTPNGAYVTYSLNNVYKDGSYQGPVTISSTAKEPTMTVKIQKNFYGDQKTALTHLVVPESYVPKSNGGGK